MNLVNYFSIVLAILGSFSALAMDPQGPALRPNPRNQFQRTKRIGDLRTVLTGSQEGAQEVDNSLAVATSALDTSPDEQKVLSPRRRAPEPRAALAGSHNQIHRQPEELQSILLNSSEADIPRLQPFGGNEPLGQRRKSKSLDALPKAVDSTGLVTPRCGPNGPEGLRTRSNEHITPAKKSRLAFLKKDAPQKPEWAKVKNKYRHYVESYFGYSSPLNTKSEQDKATYIKERLEALKMLQPAARRLNLRESENNADLWNYFKTITKESIYPQLAATRKDALNFFSSPNIKDSTAGYLSFLQNYIVPIIENTPLEVKQFFYDLAHVIGHEETEPSFNPFDYAMSNYMLYIVTPLIKRDRYDMIHFSNKELKDYESREMDRPFEDLLENVKSQISMHTMDKVNATYLNEGEKKKYDSQLGVLLQRSFNELMSKDDIDIPNKHSFLIPFCQLFLKKDDPASHKEFNQFKRALTELFFTPVQSGNH